MFNDIQTQFHSITLEALAQKYHYSERQVIRIIQDCTGKTFTQLLIQLRMNQAARMLTARTASIDVIAAKVGYSTLSSFYRAFTKYYNCTPKDYPQSFQSEQQ